MRAAVLVVDVVGVGEHLLDVAAIPLHGDIDGDRDGRVLVGDGDGERDHVFVNGLLVLVEELDELADATAVLVDFAARAGGLALVGQDDHQSGVEERQLAQATCEDVEGELGEGEDLGVGAEGDLGAVVIGLADGDEGGDGDAATILLEPDPAFAADLHLEVFGDGVDGGDTDAVEASGDAVAGVVELAAGVQDGHDDFGGADAFLVHADGDAAAVVIDGHRAIEVQRDRDGGAVASEVLVDAVVDRFPDEVVQAGSIVNVADVHAGALANGLESLQDGDVAGAVFVGRRGHGGRACGIRVAHLRPWQ